MKRGVSCVVDDSLPSWHPSDLIAEAIHGVAFLRGLHDLTLESPAFLEVFVLLFVLLAFLILGYSWLALLC